MTIRNSDPDAVIDGIYASVLEASSVDLQRLLSTALDSPMSTLMRIDEAVTSISSIGFNPATLESYDEHFHRTDPWIAAGMSLPLGTAINVERLVSRDVYLASEFYHDFMRPHGDATQLMGVMIPADQARYSLTFMRIGGQPDFDEAQEQQFARWTPHLRRAFATRDRVDGLRRAEGNICGTHADTDLIHMVVSTDLTIRWMSRDDPGTIAGLTVRKRPAGTAKVEASSPETQTALLRAVHAATGHPRLSGAVRHGEDFILVDPCPWDTGGEPAALIHLPDRAAIETRAIERATSLFGLTAAEAALCRPLMHGDTIERHACAMGLSPWTVRTHLRNIFGKTGTGRQAELVALLHRIAR
ncbi:helix-turn-helix transcriptional regulator [Sphingomonas sp.]|uniref:helix-turn-helix transcriptional regulator n=1 Tax=Sphingomonas sp. TaxID=28214 RepID=UPI002ED81EF6